MFSLTNTVDEYLYVPYSLWRLPEIAGCKSKAQAIVSPLWARHPKVPPNTSIVIDTAITIVEIITWMSLQNPTFSLNCKRR